MNDEEIKKILESDEADSDLRELDKNLRSKILLKSLEVHRQNPYEILEITHRASKEALRERYHEISKMFHPDRFFKKKLGHYKRRLESIFSTIQKAYAVLKNPIEKEALDLKLKLQESKSSSLSNVDKKPLKLSPEMEKMGKAEALYKKALQLESQKSYSDAADSLREAIKLQPKREIYKQAYDRIIPLAQSKQSERSAFILANRIDELGWSVEIFQEVENAYKMQPQLIELQTLLGRGIVEMRLIDRARDAKEMLFRAKAHQPQNNDVCIALAKAYVMLGDKKAAEKELQTLIKKSPDYLPALKLLEKI